MAKEFDRTEETIASPTDIQEWETYQGTRLCHQIQGGDLRQKVQKQLRRTDPTNTIDTSNIAAVLHPLHSYLQKAYLRISEGQSSNQ